MLLNQTGLYRSLDKSINTFHKPVLGCNILNKFHDIQGVCLGAMEQNNLLKEECVYYIKYMFMLYNYK